MINKNSIEYDSLTGLFSRWKIRMSLQEIIDSGENRVLTYLDVDNFKAINAQYGNEKGDAALIAIGQALTKTYPDMMIGRLSADEFAIIIDAGRYSRDDMNKQTRNLFKNLHEIHVEGMEGYRFTFSIAAVFVVPEHHTHPDLVIREAHELHQISKKHEGNYLSTLNGMIPDVEGAFQILREDRKLYNEINNHLFDTLNEQSWLANLQDGAIRKEQMYHRNQSQLEDIYEFYRGVNLPDSEYELLFMEIMSDADSLDAFLRSDLIESILLPYYEKCDLTDPRICSYLGHLYLLLGHSLLSVARMGAESENVRVIECMKKAYEICKDFPHDSIRFEPAFYALCEMVGHYESVSHQIFPKEECDYCYAQLRELVLGADPFVMPEKGVYRFFETVVMNASLYPIYRVCFLKMKGDLITDEEKAELAKQIAFIRLHQKNGCYDMVQSDPDLSRLTVYLQHMILEELPDKELLNDLISGIRQIRIMEYGRLSESNLIVISYLFLATSKVILRADLPQDEKLKLSCKGLNFLLDILRSRESLASDHQLLFLVRIMINVMMSSPILSPLDKFYYMEQIMAAISLDAYSHSMALSNYARVILANIIDHYPQLLVGSDRLYASVEEAQANREPLLQFMDYVCRLHDIGKISLIPITSNAFRRLSDQEFALIKMHTIFGKQILNHDASFSLFVPIVYHHHRWYNEEKGYPFIPDNEHNYRLKVLTDILSICDSIEAGTSRVGRNYRRAKTFLQIMDELLTDAGSRYSQEVINSIISSSETYLQVRSMVDVRWESLYRSIFQNVIRNQKDEYMHTQGALPDIFAYSKQPQDVQSLATQRDGLVMPEFIKQMDKETLDVFIMAMMHQNRLSVMRYNSLMFFYNVEQDCLYYLMCDENGKFSNTVAEDYSLYPKAAYLSHEGYEKAMQLIGRVIHESDYPKEGQVTLEYLDKSKCLLAHYSSVIDVNGKVKSVLGHLEDINTSKEKMLRTIDRQNRYGKVTESLGKMFEIIVYTDSELKNLELIKASSAIRSQAGSMTSTKDFIRFSLENVVDPEYQDAFKEFVDPRTLNERLSGRPYITLEYKSRLSGWLFSRIIPVSSDVEGKITHFLFVAESANVAHKEKEELNVLAKYDGLTGLMNRIYGENLIREEIAKGGKQIFAILDCDHFKRINDYLSHLVGDEVLRQQSGIMRQVFTGFHIMRLGGDEFVVYANGEVAHRLIYSFDGVNKIFHDFASHISDIRIKELENIAPTMSCGVAFCSHSVITTFEDFYALADSALQESKKKREGCITIYELSGNK